MTIEILKDLRDYTPIKGFANEPISDHEINVLEVDYNNGKPFPTALRELLSIAGKYCYLLEYGISETQQELQNRGKRILAITNLSISRPYYVIDLSTDDFSFVYLDEDQVDPIMHSIYSNNNNYELGHFYSFEMTLSQFINSRLELKKKGHNPF